MNEAASGRSAQIDLYMLGQGKVVFDARPEENQATVLFVADKGAFSLVLDRHSLLKLADVVIEAMDAMSADSATVSGLAWHLAETRTNAKPDSDTDAKPGADTDATTSTGRTP